MDMQAEKMTEMLVALSVASAEHGERIKFTEKGVSNFRDFTDEVRAVNGEVRDFITEYKASKDAETDFHNRRDREIKDALAKTDAEATRRNNLIMAWFAFFGLIITLLSFILGTFVYLEGRRQLKSGEVYQTAQQANPPQDTLNNPTAYANGR